VLRNGEVSRSAAQLVRDFLALSGGELLAKLAGFAAFAYLARTLSAEGYGGFGPIGARELAREPARAAQLAAAIPTARSALALLGVAGMVLCSFLLDQPRETRALIRIYAVSLLAVPWTLNWLLQGLDLMPWVALAQAVRMITFALGVVVFVSGGGDLWKVGAVEIGAAAAMAGYYLLVQRSRVAPVRLGSPLSLLRQLTVEAFPVGLGRILWGLGHYSATMLVAILVGGAEIAWFGAGHRIVTSLGTFVYLYHFNLYPQLVRTVGAKPGALEELLGPSFRVAAWLGVLAGLAGSLLAEPVCRLIFGAPFSAAAPAFAVLIWVVPASLLGAHANFALIAYARQRNELVANAVGAVVVVLLGLAWIGRWGALGAAAAMLASTLATWGVAQLFARRQVGRVPFVRPLIRPGLSALGAAALWAWLPVESHWTASAIGIGAYVAAAPLIEPALFRDLRRLRIGAGTRLGEGRGGQS
jgi:O-antigen/teichoic acid export membrane protein